MDDATIARYQQGGDIFRTLVNTYGLSAAQQVAEAAQTGDRGQVSLALGIVRNGAPLDDSTTHIFLDQLATDPLAAPLASANKLVGNSVWSFLKNPYALAAIVVGLFFWLGGADLIRAWFKRFK